MLYVTTRSDQDAYTAQRVLSENRGPDGGLYVPFHAPELPPEEIDALADKDFNTCVADTLNLLFQTNLTRWDVDMCVGKRPVRFATLNHRVLVAESWHNLAGEFSRMAENLAGHMSVDQDGKAQPGSWAQVGVRIAVLFGVCGELMRRGFVSRERPFDVTLVSGDVSGAISAWYARKWGLPIGTIVCCCNENNSLWELLRQGQLRTEAVSLTTLTPEADVVVPESLERLIYACGGVAEVEHYVDRCRRGKTYYPSEELRESLHRGIYVSVVSGRRMMETIPNIYNTTGYLLSPYDSLAYAGLLDYRSRMGESRCAVVLSERRPDRDAETVASALSITVQELRKRLERS